MATLPPPPPHPPPPPPPGRFHSHVDARHHRLRLHELRRLGPSPPRLLRLLQGSRLPLPHTPQRPQPSRTALLGGGCSLFVVYTFTLLVFMILVNIFIAILQDNYTDVHDTISEWKPPKAAVSWPELGSAGWEVV